MRGRADFLDEPLQNACEYATLDDELIVSKAACTNRQRRGFRNITREGVVISGVDLAGSYRFHISDVLLSHFSFAERGVPHPGEGRIVATCLVL